MANKVLTMAGLGAIAIACITLIVTYSIIPMIGEEVDNAITLPTNTAATGTFTSTTNLSKAEMDTNTTTINISTETYTFTNGTNAAFDIDVSGGNNNSSQIIALFVAEINANSTLVTAVDNGDNTTTVTAVVQTAAGNAYATTDNATGQAWSATALSGGVTGSNWDSASNTNMPTSFGFWESISPFITLAAIMLLVGGVISTLKGLRN